MVMVDTVDHGSTHPAVVSAAALTQLKTHELILPSKARIIIDPIIGVVGFAATAHIAYPHFRTLPSGETTFTCHCHLCDISQYTIW
jgi:hypothetical protein